MLICTWNKRIEESKWYFILFIKDPILGKIPTIDSNIVITNYKSNYTFNIT